MEVHQGLGKGILMRSDSAVALSMAEKYTRQDP